MDNHYVQVTSHPMLLRHRVIITCHQRQPPCPTEFSILDQCMMDILRGQHLHLQFSLWKPALKDIFGLSIALMG